MNYSMDTIPLFGPYALRKLRAEDAAAVPETSELIVGTGEHECYTPEYRALTRDFYLKF